jgi:MFS family permease
MSSTTLVSHTSGTPPDRDPATDPPRHGSAVVLAVALAGSTLLHGLCAAHIASVLPAIQATFPGTQTTWVGAAFFLAAAVAAPLGGRIADLLGARRVAVGGLLLIAVASVAAGLAPSLPALVAARSVLGIGCAVQFPAALAILRQARVLRAPMVLGAIALSNEISFTTAPSISNVLSQFGGWRTALVAPAVLAVLALAFLLWRVPGQAAPWPGARRLWTVLDLPGIAVSSTAVIVLLVWLMSLPVAVRWSLLAVLPVLIGLTWVWERGFAPAPFLPVGLFAHPNLVLTVIRHGLYFTAFYVLFYALPSWLSGRGLSALQVALVLAVLPLVAILTRVITPSVERIGARWALLVGGAGLAAAAGAAMVVGGDGPLVAAVAIVALLGVPTGLVNNANQFVLYTSAPAATTGTISGIYRSVQFLAGGLAAALTQISGGPQGVQQLAIVAGVGALLLIAASTSGTGPARGPRVLTAVAEPGGRP